MCWSKQISCSAQQFDTPNKVQRQKDTIFSFFTASYRYPLLDRQFDIFVDTVQCPVVSRLLSLSLSLFLCAVKQTTSERSIS